MLCSAYRPPNSDNTFWRKLSWSTEKASDDSDKIILVGDLNVDFLNIPHTHSVLDLLSSHFLENTITEPTRVTQNTSTLIDPILVTRDIPVFESGVLNVDHSVSDHKATYVCVKTNLNLNCAYKRKVWLYKNADFDRLNSLITNTDWETLIMRTDNVHNATVNFSHTFLFSY